MSEKYEGISKVIDKVNISEYGALFSYLLGIILFFISFVLLYKGVNVYNIEINGDNFVNILGGVFISALILIIIPLYFGVKNKELDNKSKELDNKNKELDNKEKEIRIECIKEIIEDNIDDLKEMKSVLNENKKNINDIGFDVNNFRLDNLDLDRYLIKLKGETKEIRRDNRFIVGYNMGTKKFYLIKKNIPIEFNKNITDTFKKNFVYYPEDYPYFIFSDDDKDIKSKIIKILKVLKI